MNFEPFKTISPFNGLFNVDSRGFTQGVAQDDPATRLQLCSGMVGNVVNPLWGGMGVIEAISTVDENVAGSTIISATATTCNAFTVFNQAYHGITTGNNSVPLYPQGGSVHFYRIGSGARIPLPISPQVAALANGSEPVGSDGFVWDVNNGFVDIYLSGTSSNPKVDISLLSVSPNGGITVFRNSGTGDVNWSVGQPIGLFMI